MPTNATKISIGIPTYNGAGRIGNALESILVQLSSDVAASVEVVISDNASTDDVSSVIASYADRFPCSIAYHKNDVNIGYDRNVDAVFRHAKGQYVWLLADDDVLKSGAISQVLSMLSSHNDLKVVQLNFQSYDSKMERVVHEVVMPHDLLCEDAETFLLNSAGRYGQVSTLIFNRLAWYNAGVEEAFGLNYIHIYALLKVLLTGKSYVSKVPWVNVRMGSENFGTSGDALILTPLGAGRIFSQMRDMGYRSQIARDLQLENRRYIFRKIPYAKNKGIAHPLEIIRKLLAVHNSLELWFLWIPIIASPTALFRLIYRFQKYVKQAAKCC